MPGVTKIEIRGAKEMEQVLEQLYPEVAERVADRALSAAADVIIEEAQRLVPEKSGDLKSSITKAKPKSPLFQSRTILIGFKPPHSRRAHLTEFGTSKAKAKPFMRPAMDSKSDEALAVMGEKLHAGMTRAARKLAKK